MIDQEIEDDIPGLRLAVEGAVSGLTPSLSPSPVCLLNVFFGEVLINVSFLLPGETDRAGAEISSLGRSATLGACVTKIAVRLASPLPRRD